MRAVSATTAASNAGPDCGMISDDTRGAIQPIISTGMTRPFRAGVERGGSDPLHSVELRPAVMHVLQVFVEGGGLVVHAERHIAGVLPEVSLHIAADFLLRREVRRGEPLVAQRLHLGIGRPTEPGIGA